MSTKLNVNIRTLLSNCEELAKDDSNHWRLKKFIRSLDLMIDELREYEEDNSAALSKIADYNSRLDALKKTTNYIDPTTTTTAGDTTQAEAAPKPDNTTSTDSLQIDAMHEIRQWQSSVQYKNLRKELLSEDGLRRRKPEESAGPADTENNSMEMYTKQHEQIAEHMLSLTRNLKENTETANRIIKQDTANVTLSTGLTDRNINSLQKETEKLADHSRNAYKCWMWMMISFVIIVFIGMVLFMKIMKKKKA